MFPPVLLLFEVKGGGEDNSVEVEVPSSELGQHISFTAGQPGKGRTCCTDGYITASLGIVGGIFPTDGAPSW
jgi:hypothetical protein